MIGWRWLIVVARLAAILLLFGAVLLPHLLLTAFGQRGLVPPRFLAIAGWIAGLRVRKEGAPAPGPLLLIANHVSWLDILVLAGASRAAFVAHGGLAGQPFLRWLCEQNDTLFVARERRKTVNGQVNGLRAALLRRRMVVFPEGTTSDGAAVLPFKSALLSAVEDAGLVTVQPVALDYADAGAIAWHGVEAGADNVLRILARTRSIHVTAHFLAPLAGPARGDRKAMAAAAQAQIEHRLGLRPDLSKAVPMP